MSIKSDFLLFDLEINNITNDPHIYLPILEKKYKQLILKYHPDRLITNNNKDYNNEYNYNQINESYNNILVFLNKRVNCFKKVLKSDLLKEIVFCRCGSLYTRTTYSDINDKEYVDIFVDCLFCSCFIEVVD
ncbi:hypothetical protein CDIK_2527 [Cucumispora dikerogammari]|nr:hypothetical protein CDIK_2527 [Cucumispora dikerogammari]